jgi:3-hydroxy-9,10-secoandrosta-1,3,5(10)-triene-9,17-dione monooxygenase reductase component
MAPAVDQRDFRDTLGLFATGVAVVVTRAGDDVRAMTANAFSSLSLDPPMVLFCPARKASIARNLDEVTGLTINFLREEQRALSSYFAGGWHESAPPPFRLVAADGAPRLEGALASLCCAKEQVMSAGDHLIVLGRVLALHRGVPPQRPLLFYGGRYRSVSAEAGKVAPDLVVPQDEPPHIHYSD